MCGDSGEAKGNRTITEVFDSPPPRDPSLAVPPVASGGPLFTQEVSSHASVHGHVDTGEEEQRPASSRSSELWRRGTAPR